MKAAKRTNTTVQQLRDGRFTIPAEFLEQLGITENALLQLTLEGEELRVRPVRADPDTAGSMWLGDLYDHFATVRKEGQHLNESEIDDLIDNAVRASRERDG